MNTDQPLDPAASPSELPELADDRIDRIEDAVFAEISRERTTRRRRRTGAWAVGGAAAAVIVVAAVIAPSLSGVVGDAGSDQSAVAPSAPIEDGAIGSTEDSGAADATQDSDAVKESLTSPESGESTLRDADAGESDRAIITTASATVVVDDIEAAAALITDAAKSRDGYVESMSIGSSGQVVPIDPMTGMTYDGSMPYPYPPDGAWVTVRVPAEGLQSLLDQLSGLGEVTASSVNRQDVTAVTLDLQARVDAAQASVDRLTELMSQAASVADLLAAESALAERQATLESYQQQLKYYDEQVEMSTLTVTLTQPIETVEADPAGFGDGLAAGWNGLVATLNGIVIAIGFLLPWILVLGVLALIVWSIVRFVRGRRRENARTRDASPARPAASDPDIRT